MRLVGVLAILALATIGASVPRAAQAKGTKFIVELQSGVGESAFESGGPGLAYGVSAGLTLKLKRFPVRWYLLGTVLGRNTSAAGRHLSVGFEADRRELDLFVSQRTVIPIWRMVRIYLETGIGQRLMSQTLRRGEQLGSLTESSNQLLVVLGLGVQARLTRTFSIGVRGELTPLGGGPELTQYAADLAPEPNRLGLFVQLGVHF